MPFFGGGGGAAPANMVGATDSVAGTAGLVPAPAAGNQGKALIGDGTFSFAVFPSGGNYGTDYVGWPTLTHAANIPLVLLASSTSADYWLRGSMFYPKGTYNRIGLYISTAATGGNKNAKIGIYNTDSSGKPSNLVTQGTLSCDATGVSEAVVSDFTLDSKFYYTLYKLQAQTTIWTFGAHVAPCIPWNAFAGTSQSHTFGNNNFVTGGYASDSYANALPSDLTTITGMSGTTNTWVFVRKV